MKVVIVGSGGLAREFCEWFRNSLEVCGISTKNIEEFHKYNLPGIALSPDITPQQAGTANAVLCVGSPNLKEKLYSFYTQRGFCFPHIIHSTSVVSHSAIISEGCVITPNVIIGPNTSLGKCTYLNFGSSIAHDGKIGDFCQINPCACINGSVTIGDRCTIGSRTVLLQGISITNDVTTAIGSTIFSNVRHSCTMIGNPAKKMFIPSQHNS